MKVTLKIVHGSYSDYKDALDESSGGKTPFYMTNGSTATSAKTVRTVEADEADTNTDTDNSVDNQTKFSNTSVDNSGIINKYSRYFQRIP